MPERNEANCTKTCLDTRADENPKLRADGNLNYVLSDAQFPLFWCTVSTWQLLQKRFSQRQFEVFLGLSREWTVYNCTTAKNLKRKAQTNPKLPFQKKKSSKLPHGTWPQICHRKPHNFFSILETTPCTRNPEIQQGTATAATRTRGTSKLFTTESSVVKTVKTTSNPRQS